MGALHKCKFQKLSLFVFAEVAWALWKSRNKMALEKTISFASTGDNPLRHCVCAEMEAAVEGS
jgi:hypothetical protein